MNIVAKVCVFVCTYHCKAAYLSGPMFLSPHTGYISSSFAVQVVAFPPKSCLVVNWTQLVGGKL